MRLLAVRRGHVFAADMAAREMGSLSLADALALCVLYRAEGDPRFERAFTRWLRRVQRQSCLFSSQFSPGARYERSWGDLGLVIRSIRGAVEEVGTAGQSSEVPELLEQLG